MQVLLLPTATVRGALAGIRQQLAGDLAEDLHRLREVATPHADHAGRSAARPARPLRRPATANGCCASSPSESLWEFPRRWSSSPNKSTTVDPTATGKPFGTVEGLRAMKNGLQTGGHLRLPGHRGGAVARFPQLEAHGCGAWRRWCWRVIFSLGILGLFGVPLNPANMIAFPLILGVGVDNGVHILHDYLLRRRGPRARPSATPSAAACWSRR